MADNCYLPIWIRTFLDDPEMSVSRVFLFKYHFIFILFITHMLFPETGNGNPDKKPPCTLGGSRQVTRHLTQDLESLREHYHYGLRNPIFTNLVENNDVLGKHGLSLLSITRSILDASLHSRLTRIPEVAVRAAHAAPIKRPNYIYGHRGCDVILLPACQNLSSKSSLVKLMKLRVPHSRFIPFRIGNPDSG
ncbi:hypothetical protein F5B20DRAFT_545503 [Whalleya microplaca]|nr:hypothetical protein F5B20DRAFT_545503 [Whalleya microplaca]